MFVYIYLNINHINKFNLSNRINILNEDALVSNINDKFDLIFIDASKGNNINFFNKYKVNLNKIGDRKFANMIAINNSIIISVTFYLTGIFFNKAIFQILLAFPILILLIIFLYSLTGRYLKKHE